MKFHPSECRLAAGLIALSLTFAGPASSAPARVRPRLFGAVSYHFDASESWATGSLTERTCKYGCWIQPQSLALTTHVNDDGSVSSGHTYRFMNDLSRAQRWHVAAWVNASGATDTTGLQFRVDDVLTIASDAAPELRSRIEIRTDVYRGDVAPGWQRVELGSLNVLGRPDQERTLVSIYMINQNNRPDGSWLVGAIEFDPVDDSSAVKDLP